MALPIIAAGVAARYGAKKLAKYLVKRNTKKPQKLPGTIGPKKPGTIPKEKLDARSERRGINKIDKELRKMRKESMNPNSKGGSYGREEKAAETYMMRDNLLTNTRSTARKRLLKK